MNIAISGIKLKILMRTSRKFNFSDIMKLNILTLIPNGVIRCHRVWYKIEGLEEILNIIRFKWISFTFSVHPTLKWGQPVNIAIFGIKWKVLMRT